MCNCTKCGELFDAKDKTAFIHPTLFGGIDRICGACVKHEEELRKKRVNGAGIGLKNKNG
jgi:hypothetical protein